MAPRRPSLIDLRRQVAEEKKRIAKATERRQLSSELRELQRGQKTSVRLARRFGRGLRVTAKKVGIGLARQAERIAAAQRQQAKTVRRKVKKKRKPFSSANRGVQNLDLLFRF